MIKHKWTELVKQDTCAGGALWVWSAIHILGPRYEGEQNTKFWNKCLTFPEFTLSLSLSPLSELRGLRQGHLFSAEVAAGPHPKLIKGKSFCDMEATCEFRSSVGMRNGVMPCAFVMSVSSSLGFEASYVVADKFNGANLLGLYVALWN